MKLFLGIDNGVTGSIGFILGEEAATFKIPTISHKSYTKAPAKITRVDHVELSEMLKPLFKKAADYVIAVERPMINPTRWKASCSAMRCLEAVTIVLEQLNKSFSFVDSKEWQKQLIPGVEGRDNLKIQAAKKAQELFGIVTTDADGLMIAAHLKRLDVATKVA